MNEDRRWQRQIRMTEEEYKVACEDAQATGMSFSEYVRQLVEKARKRKKGKGK